MSEAITTEELARRVDDPDAAPFILDVRAPDQFERWRVEGKGPAFRKFGKRAVYAETDLLEWSEAQRRTSTSDNESHVA